MLIQGQSTLNRGYTLNTHDLIKINMELLFNIKTTSLSLPLVTDITNSCSILTSQVHDPFPLIVSLQMPRPLQAGTPGQAMTRYNYNIIMKDSVEREQYKCFMKNEPCWEKIGHAHLFMCIKHFPTFFPNIMYVKKSVFGSIFIIRSLQKNKPTACQNNESSETIHIHPGTVIS